MYIAFQHSDLGNPQLALLLGLRTVGCALDLLAGSPACWTALQLPIPTTTLSAGTVHGIIDSVSHSNYNGHCILHSLIQVHPHILLSLQFSCALESLATYRFPTVLCSRISFRLSVRWVDFPVTVGSRYHQPAIRSALSGRTLWINIVETGDISTLVPAIAMTDAAEAAMPSIFTVTDPL